MLEHGNSFGWTVQTCDLIALAMATVANFTLRSWSPSKTKKKPDIVGALKNFIYLLIALTAFLVFTGTYMGFTFIVVAGAMCGVEPS